MGVGVDVIIGLARRRDALFFDAFARKPSVDSDFAIVAGCAAVFGVVGFANIVLGEVVSLGAAHRGANAVLA